MEKYLGVKLVEAEPCYGLNNKCVDLMSEHCRNEQSGYKVVYEDGYTSWSPRDVFEKSYRKIKLPDDYCQFNLKDKPEYQVRVINELVELNEKIIKLESFMVNPATPFVILKNDEQDRLKQQLLAMKYYLTILVERIENF